MKKQLLSLLLLAALLAGLTACGGEEASVPVSSQATEEALPTATLPPRVEVTQVPETLFGTVTDGVYQNTLLGISYALKEEWYYLSDAQRAKSNGLSGAEATAEARVQAVKASGTYYDMAAYATSGSSRVSVTFTHTGSFYGTTLTAQEYADKMLEQLTGRLSGIDVSVISAELGTCWFANNEYPCLWFVFFEDGTTCYQTQVYLRAGDFVATVTATSLEQGKSGDLLDRFEHISQ